jgi:soluble lytic murein transglycosylase-like protein
MMRRAGAGFGIPGLAAAAALVFAAPAFADRQQDPGLRSVIAAAIKEKPCFAAKYDDVVWFALMRPRVETRLRAQPPDLRLGDDIQAAAERILKAVSCEASKHTMLADRPQLVLAVIDVESAFDPFAVSYAGAVGLMQVMPFWPTELGLTRKDLIDVELNIRMGTAILAYYLERERGDYRRALSRYNGSLGRREYPDLVLGRLNSRWRR